MFFSATGSSLKIMWFLRRVCLLVVLARMQLLIPGVVAND